MNRIRASVRLLFRSAIIVAVVLGATGCGESVVPKIRVSVNSWVGFGPLYVARDGGIFKRNGIDVEIVKMENAPDRRAALLTGRVEILGSTMDDLAVTVSQGVDAVAVACADFSNGGDGILGAGNVKSLKDLAGAPVAVQPGFVNHFFLLYVLDANGVKTDSLNILPMTPDDAGSAFLAERVNAAVTWEPYLTQGLRKRSGAILLASTKDYPEAILDMFVSSRAWATQQRGQLDAFRRSWDEAVIEIALHPDSSIGIISRELAIPATDLRQMFDKVALLKQPECRSLLSTKLDTLADRISRLWRAAGFLNRDVDVRKAVLLDSL